MDSEFSAFIFICDRSRNLRRTPTIPEKLSTYTLAESLTPQLRRAISALPAARQASWITKFTRSTRAFAKAQTRVSSNLSQGKTPSLAEYIICRREVFAASLFWDVVDLLDIVEQPTGRTALEQEKIALITQCAVDIVVWTIDIFAYASPTRCTTHNLISLLTRYKNLSVQAAMNYAGGMVRERLEEFHHLERTLLLLSGPATDDPQDATSSSWAARWIWALPSAIGLADTSGSQRDKRPYLSGIPFQAATEDGWCLGEMDQAEAATLEGGERSNEETKRDEAQLKRYVVALKDYILGSMHWGYETELYFGQKGEEIRSFGWVFLSNNVAT